MLNALLEQVKNAIFSSSTTPHQPGHDPDGLIGQISGLFGQHQQQAGTMQNPLPASQDPYGDPADQFPNQYSNGQRPGNRAYADGGPQGQFPGLKSASEDPYGDPADLERR